MGLPLGVITTKWAMAYLVKDLMYYVIHVDMAVYVITGLIAIASAVVASYISARHITKARLADTIRQRGRARGRASKPRWSKCWSTSPK